MPLADPPVPGKVASTLRECLALYAELRHKGMDYETACGVLEGALRGAWPRGRHDPWHYVCTVCDDTGWRRQDYEHQRFGLVRAVVPCDCLKGRGYRDAQDHARQRQASSSRVRRFTKVGA